MAKNNSFSQSWFDLRDIVWPSPAKGKGQRFRSDIRNITMTIGSQGDKAEKADNVSKWAEATIVHRTGICRDNWREYRDWLIDQGILKAEAQPGSVVHYWIDHKTLRRIVAAQQAEKKAWDEAEQAKQQANLDYEKKYWLPQVGFDEWDTYKAVDVEPLEEPQSEPQQEPPTESLAESQNEASDESLQNHRGLSDSVYNGQSPLREDPDTSVGF